MFYLVFPFLFRPLFIIKTSYPQTLSLVSIEGRLFDVENSDTSATFPRHLRKNKILPKISRVGDDYNTLHKSYEIIKVFVALASVQYKSQYYHTLVYYRGKAHNPNTSQHTDTLHSSTQSTIYTIGPGFLSSYSGKIETPPTLPQTPPSRLLIRNMVDRWKVHTGERGQERPQKSQHSGNHVISFIEPKLIP